MVPRAAKSSRRTSHTRTPERASSAQPRNPAQVGMVNHVARARASSRDPPSLGRVTGSHRLITTKRKHPPNRPTEPFDHASCRLHGYLRRPLLRLDGSLRSGPSEGTAIRGPIRTTIEAASIQMESQTTQPALPMAVMHQLRLSKRLIAARLRVIRRPFLRRYGVPRLGWTR